MKTARIYLRLAFSERDLAVVALTQEIERLRSVWGLYEVGPTAEPVDLIQLKDNGDLWFNDRLKLTHLMGIERVFAVELLLHKMIRQGAPVGAWFHAAATVVADCLILIAGESGAGKTSLTLELLAKEAKYLSDDRVWTDGVRWVGLLRHLQFKPMRDGDPLPERLRRPDLILLTHTDSQGSLTVPVVSVPQGQVISTLSPKHVRAFVLGESSGNKKATLLPPFDGLRSLLSHSEGFCAVESDLKVYELSPADDWTDSAKQILDLALE